MLSFWKYGIEILLGFLKIAKLVVRTGTGIEIWIRILKFYNYSDPNLSLLTGTGIFVIYF